ncbi:MAG: TldD/PmbA family protein [Chloroflexi bacterium]|nr:TldD/PmbA family protein [Chloroflexota bacterium]
MSEVQPKHRGHNPVARRPLLRRVLIGLAAITLAATPMAGQSIVLDAMKAELDRSMELLGEQEVPPYFLSYEITEMHGVTVAGEFGALSSSNESRQRLLDLDLRVGDYSLDNTRPIRDDLFSSVFRGFGPTSIPVDDDPDAIRSILWSETDKNYKSALEQLTQVKTNVQVKVETEDQSDDFSREVASKASDEPRPIEAERTDWEQKVRRYSAPFAEHGEFLEGSASLRAGTETRWFVNSDGSEIQTSETRYRLFIAATTKADDGMELPLYKSYSSFTPDGLPDDETVERDVRRMIEILLALREAPLVEPYTGPAILSGEASGVFFHEILGHRLEGHRLKEVDDSHTFREQLNQRVLPETFSVHFDPTVRTYGPSDLVGSYRYDNQGIAAQRVTAIDKGILKSYLMSRTPAEGFPKSNGHGRKQAGLKPVARQSNLIVEVSDPLTTEELNARFFEAIEAAGKSFGLRIEEIEGGFTFTGRAIPNSFNVSPLLVYRVYPDGRQELVRGVDLIGTPLVTFSRVIAADDQIGVFNGFCGAESGSVPVSAAAPSILVSQIEVQKKPRSQDRPPLLPAPVGDL